MFKTLRFLTITQTILVYSWYSMTGNKTVALRTLFYDFSRLGGLYIKFLQLLVIRGDFKDIDVGSLADKLAVFDNNPYEHIDLRRKLKADLGRKADEIIIEDDHPVAAGSFGQVYKGTLADNTPVAIKILRPRVSKYLAFDLRLLGMAAKTIAIFKPDGFLDIKEVFADFKNITLSETNYHTEARWALDAHKKLETDPILSVPKTHIDLCSEHILVQEFVDGVPLSEIMAQTTEDTAREYVLKHFDTDLSVIIEALAYESLSVLLESGGGHGDPHPGNIYIQRNNRAALIDFGIITTPVKRKQELLGLISEYVNFYEGQFVPEHFMVKMMHSFVPKLTNALYVVGQATGTNVADRAMTMLGDIAGDEVRKQSDNPRLQRVIKEYKIINIFSEIINRGNRFGVTADIESLTFMRSSVMFLSLADRLGLKRMAIGSAYKRIIRDYDNQHLPYQSATDAQTVDESFHYLASWLERLQYNDPTSYNKLAKVLR